MPNKSSFNSGRSGRIGGKSPNNSSITAGNFKGAGYSDADIISASRRNIGQEYNKFQDKLRKEFEQYLQNQKAERNIGLEVVFTLIENFLKERKAETQFKRQIEDGRVAVNELLSNQNQLKELESNFQNKSSKRITLPKLIMTLATAALVFNQTDFKLENKPRSLDGSAGKDDFSDTPNIALNKAGNALALGAAGGLVAGPIGAVAGASIGLIGGVEARKQKTADQKTQLNSKQPTNQVSKKEFQDFFGAVGNGNLNHVRSKINRAKKDGTLESLLTSFEPKYHFSPLYIAANLGKTEVVKEILAAVKDKPEILEKILTQTNQKGESPLYMAANLGKTEVVKEILAAVKDNPKLLEKILTQTSQEGESPLYTAASLGRTEVVKEILAAVKDKPEILGKILTQTDKKGVSPLCTAANLGKTESVKEILAAVKDKPEILGKILIKTNQKGDSPLYTAANLGRTEVVEEILAAVKDKPEILEKILTQTDKKGTSSFYAAVSLGRTEVAKEILAAVKDKPEILEKILTQTNQKGKSPLFSTASFGRTEVVKEILNAVKDEIELLKKLINHKLQEAQNASPSIVKYLLLSGNDEVLKIILRIDPDLVAEKLPKIYYSKLPKTAIYYLEALKTNLPLGTKIKYFEIDQDYKIKETKISNIRLDSDNPNPTIVEVENGNKTRRILLANDIESNDFKAESIKLKKAVEVANNKLPKTDIVIFNLAVEYSEIDRHALTIKLVRNNAKNGWDVVIHDPNSYSRDRRPDSWKKINKQTVTKLCEEAGIKITPLKEVKAIIPNYSNKDINNGSCDMISSIVAASMILGESHSEQLREKCDEIGIKCVEGLGSELNPKIDKILEARLQRIKGDLQKEKKEREVPATSSIEGARAEKVRNKEIERDL